MTAGDRFKNWIDGLAQSWADRLRSWMASWFSWGIDLFFDVLSKSASPKLKPIIDTLEATAKVPPELKPLLDELKEPTGEAGAMFAQSAGGALIGGAVGRIMDAILLPMAYAINSSTKNVILSPDQLLWLWRREYISETLVDQYLSWLGYNEEDVGHWKELTLFIPSADEQTLWLAREVYEPDMVAKYGLDAELPVYEDTDFSKVGVNPEQMRNKWRAHWSHASWMQMVEMLHRGLVTEADVYEWFKMVEIVPHWRDLLIQTAYTWPTRVDVRRWWDMRTIDETELRRLYSGMGYRGVNLDNYVLWTKVYVSFPDLMARWTKGWITIDDVRRELTELGMPAERVETMIQMKVKPEQPERVEEGKSLTKTEIYKGVKKDLITWEEGIELLMDLGYDYDEADYILTVNVGVLEGSPETFAEFKDITRKYRIATGREEKPMSEELKKAADEVVRVTKEVEDLTESITKEEATLIPDEILPEETTARLKELQVFRNRAIAELERVQSEYDRLLAEWKHGFP